MSFSHFFIKRPIFSTVLSLIIVLVGFLALKGLPIAQYPKISPPTISISATYPGASAETVSKVVAAPIEEQLNGVTGLTYFNSTASSNGSVSISVTFDVGTDIDIAMVDINNRVKMVEPRLPEEVRRNGVSVRKRSDEMLMVLSLSSPDKSRDTLFLSNYAKLNIVDDLKRVPGVGDVRVFGARDYSMRIWIDPVKMASLGVTTTDVNSAIRAQNAQNAVGKIGEEPISQEQSLTYTVTAKGRLLSEHDFANIIIRQDAGQGAVLVKDIARVELGAQDYSSASYINGNPSVGIGINLQPNANALDVAERVKAEMVKIEDRFPNGVEYLIAYDTTTFINESINAVLATLIEALILVTLVMFLFLQNWRATLIPLLAVPVSIVGSLAGLWLLGFSINTLTLFAMVLAIGIVVDDAIVVIENVERLMHEKGLDAKEAAYQAMTEVSGALVAIVLVLCAVFIPVSFLGGMAGMLYKQFAVTVAISIFLSGIVALTLTPALCALMLKPQKAQNRFFDLFNRGFDRITCAYTYLVSSTLKRQVASLILFVMVAVGLVILALNIPRSFVPAEDQGVLIGSIQLSDGASLSRTTEFSEEFRQILMQNPNVDRVLAISGFDFVGGGNKPNAGAMFINLKPWAEREELAQNLAGQFMGMGMSLQDGIGLVFNPPAIQGLGSTGGFEFYLQNRADGDPIQLASELNAFIDALRADSRFASINTFYRADVPQLYVEIDEPKAISMGLSLANIYETLQSTIGSQYVNDFNLSGKTYRVQVQADQEHRNEPKDILSLYVRNNKGDLISLSTFAKVEFISGPEQIQRFNGFVSAKVTGNSIQGMSSGDSIKAVLEVAEKTLPDGYHIEWTGQAYQELNSGSTTNLAFGFAILMVFLILSAQYERWSLPVAVIMSLPFALLGAFGALLLRGMPNDIYFQIGLVVLVGLAAKNAILIVEFAQQKRDQGLPLAEAALEAAKLRFRPIVMTSLAFVLGIVPLVMATGAGASARQSMGTGVFGGMLVSTFIATIFVPLFFLWLSSAGQRWSNRTKETHDV